MTSLRGATEVGAGATVGPHTTAIDSRIGARASVRSSWLQEADVGEGASVGPFAYLRPGAQLREGAKAGTFVEIKNSDIGAGAKIPHLSYIGDADVGAGANLGAGTITANYDGHAKHRTTIGARVRGGVDTAFVAPVTVGDDAYTAAGSVITEDVPPGALGVARARQQNRDGYAQRRAAEHEASTRGTTPRAPAPGGEPAHADDPPEDRDEQGAADRDTRRRAPGLYTSRDDEQRDRHAHAVGGGDEPADRLQQAADAVRGSREPAAGGRHRGQARRWTSAR